MNKEAASDVILDVEDLHRSYRKLGREISVLQGVNLRIHTSDMCSIRGQSGVGKSTLLHVLGTLDRPTKGTVRYYGNDIFDRPESSLAGFRNKTIGFIFQFHHLLPELTALENVALPGLIGRMGRKKALGAARELLNEVGLDQRLDHRPGELSGGEQQRVAVARALIMAPDIVFADEPTGNLDQNTSGDIHKLLFRINKTHNVAFVVVTHNASLAEMMPRRLVMREGVVYEGEP